MIGRVEIQGHGLNKQNVGHCWVNSTGSEGDPGWFGVEIRVGDFLNFVCRRYWPRGWSQAFESAPCVDDWGGRFAQSIPRHFTPNTGVLCDLSRNGTRRFCLIVHFFTYIFIRFFSCQRYCCCCCLFCRCVPMANTASNRVFYLPHRWWWTCFYAKSMCSSHPRSVFFS